MAPKKNNAPLNLNPYQNLIDSGICNAYFDSSWGDLVFEFAMAGYHSQSISVRYNPETRVVTLSATPIAGQCDSDAARETLFACFAVTALKLVFKLPIDAAPPRCTFENGLLSVISSKHLYGSDRDEAGNVLIPVDFF